MNGAKLLEVAPTLLIFKYCLKHATQHTYTDKITGKETRQENRLERASDKRRFRLVPSNLPRQTRLSLT